MWASGGASGGDAGGAGAGVGPGRAAPASVGGAGGVASGWSGPARLGERSLSLTVSPPAPTSVGGSGIRGQSCTGLVVGSLSTKVGNGKGRRPSRDGNQSRHHEERLPHHHHSEGTDRRPSRDGNQSCGDSSNHSSGRSRHHRGNRPESHHDNVHSDRRPSRDGNRSHDNSSDHSRGRSRHRREERPGSHHDIVCSDRRSPGDRNQNVHRPPDLMIRNQRRQWHHRKGRCPRDRVGKFETGRMLVLLDLGFDSTSPSSIGPSASQPMVVPILHLSHSVASDCLHILLSRFHCGFLLKDVGAEDTCPLDVDVIF